MSREIVEKTCGHFNWVQLGAAAKHPHDGKIHDISEDIAKITGVEGPSVIIHANSGYGNSNILRGLMDRYELDGILHFTDPRYWVWLYQMEHEIRQKMPIMYYNIWDSMPDPKYNRNYYRSCDALFSISKQTYGINYRVLGENAVELDLVNPPTPLPSAGTEPSTLLSYIPHGVDHENKFFPITEDNEPAVSLMQKVKKDILGGWEPGFMVFYNARNLRRKMTGDVLLAYNHFLQMLPEDEREQCRIVMHTAPVDDNGTDLPAVINDLVPDVQAIFNNTRVDATILNALYNWADVTINLASNEGFGLSTAESLMAGTPILVNVTGGLQDQCGFVNDGGELLTIEDYTGKWGSNHDGRYRVSGDWAFPVFPLTRSLNGSPITPYIFDDRASWQEAGERLLEIYQLGREERKRRGALGREFAMGPGRFTANQMGEAFIYSIDRLLEVWQPRNRYTILEV